VFDLAIQRIKNAEMIGATFVEVDCRGCMAHDHQIKWVGIGKRFENPTYVGDGLIIRVEVVKRNGDYQDFRDRAIASPYFFVEDKSIQRLAHKLYFIFK
jgi:hypothetical protein